jgi:hypothetical protein
MSEPKTKPEKPAGVSPLDALAAAWDQVCIANDALSLATQTGSRELGIVAMRVLRTRLGEMDRAVGVVLEEAQR